MSLTFLKDFRKTMDKMESVSTCFDPPSFWYHTGNYALNKILSGSFTRGIPNARVSTLAGVSGAGKSYILCNILKNAQLSGATCLVLDSENALDGNFVTKIGVDIDPEKWIYVGVSTIEDVTAVVSEFITSYVKAYGKDNPDAPKVVIALDSLDMLMSNAENEKFEKGVQTGDMGGRTRLFKHLLRTITNKIARTNIAFICTHQTYMNQDITNGLGEQIVNNAVRYSASQIAIFKALKLKDGMEIKGVRVKAECYKSRFAKPGTKIEIEVPYDKGMDQFSGVLDMMIEKGIVSQGGAWYTLSLPDQEPIKFQRKNLDMDLFKKMLSHPIIADDETLFEEADKTSNVEVEPDED